MASAQLKLFDFLFVCLLLLFLGNSVHTDVLLCNSTFVCQMTTVYVFMDNSLAVPGW